MTFDVQLPARLRADCSACVALCCVIPPFDASQGFGFDKPAETPCRHLCADHRCGIHDGLLERGFEGCVAFDCLGAGQRLTALALDRFGSTDWRSRPELSLWLFAAYPRMRLAQEWLARLSLAAAVSRPDGRGALEALAAELDADLARCPDWSAAEQRAWQARVQAALAPLAENRASSN
ncbi:hypothetical protein [Roseateles sp.]|uniref:hypothetical protein n=1 Tax=Roseateles sp. TaxID=1971397 RepID=UPI0039E7DCCB